MLKKFYQKNKTLFDNSFALFSFQVLHYIVLLVTMPYLIRVLGIEKYGLVVYAQAIINYLVSLVDYGFNISATRKVSISRDDKSELSKIFYTTIFAKIFLVIISFFILLILLVSFEQFNNDAELYLFGFLMVVGQGLMPIWFFQGIEKMQFLTYFNAVAKMITLILTFVLIRSENDYSLVLLTHGASYSLIALVSSIIAFRRFDLSFFLPSLTRIWQTLRGSWAVFLSVFFTNLYSGGLGIIVLRVFTDDRTLGFYSVADKIMSLFRTLIRTFDNAVYPKICSMTKDFQKILNFYKSTYVPVSFVFLAVAILGFILADVITWVLSGKFDSSVSFYIRLTIMIPYIIVWQKPAKHVLLAFNFNKSYLKINTLITIVSLITYPIFAYLYQGIGICIAIYITELLCGTGYYWITARYHSKYSLVNNKYK